MDQKHEVNNLYWKLLVGITLLHIVEDGIMVTFFKFAPLPLWSLYLIVFCFSMVMANYAYVISSGRTHEMLGKVKGIFFKK